MTIAQIMSAIALVSAIAGATVAIETRYAHDTDVQKVAYRLDEKIRADRCARLQEWLWRLTDRYGPSCGKEADTCRRIRQDMARMKCGR